MWPVDSKGIEGLHSEGFRATTEGTIMTTDLANTHIEALAHTRRIVAGVAPDQWGDPTPCDDWDLRALVNHVVAGNFWVAPLLEGQTIEDVGTRYDGDVLGSDPLAAYDRSSLEAQTAGSAPGALEAPCALSYGTVPGAVYLGHRILDVVIHGWDIAKATGQDPTIGPELVERCRAIMEPELGLIQGSGMFGTPVTVDEDASAEARLLATIGRQA